MKYIAAGKNTKLDAVELAMGEELIKSSKRKRELLELSFNRFVSSTYVYLRLPCLTTIITTYHVYNSYNFDDTHLPDWFMKDEKKHTKKQLPVTKVSIYSYISLSCSIIKNVLT